MHPNLVAENGPACLEADRKGVYSEYKLLQGDLLKYHEGFGAPRYDVAEEMVADNLTPRHLRYLDFLFASADNVLLQPVRLNYQIHQLRNRYPDARFIWILRRPAGFINSVLSYRKNLLEYRDAGLAGNHAISQYKSNPLFRLIRGWQTFDNPWSQIAAANLIVASRPYFRGLHDEPAWVKLAALWYDHYLFVTRFVKENPGSCNVFFYDMACASPSYLMSIMDSVGLRTAEKAFDGLIDTNVVKKHTHSRTDIADTERMLQERIAASGIDLDMSYRFTMG